MKKILVCFLTVIITLAFVGCSKKCEPLNISTNFSVNCTAQLDEFECEMYITKLGSGGWDISFTTPETINGLAVSFENENTNITFKELGFSVPSEDFPIKSIVKNITSAFDQVSGKANVEFKKKDKIITTNGNVDSGEYSFDFDEKSGSPICLEMKKINLSVNFNDYKIMQ